MLNVKINDSAFGGEDGTVYDISRYSARGVLINEKGLVAMMLMEANGRYKLPGGGIELGENERDAFIRKIAEEVGCSCEIIECLGSVEEHKLRNHFCQYSYAFFGRKTGELEGSPLTEEENRFHMGVAWMTIDDAVSVMDKAVNMENNSYSMKFMLLRDKIILEYVRDNCLGKINSVPAMCIGS